MIKFSEFCPKDCVRLNEEDPMMHEGCGHLEDIVMLTPFSAILTIGKPRVVTVVGINGNNYYIEEIMSNGTTSRSVVSRDRVARS